MRKQAKKGLERKSLRHRVDAREGFENHEFSLRLELSLLSYASRYSRIRRMRYTVEGETIISDWRA